MTYDDVPEGFQVITSKAKAPADLPDGFSVKGDAPATPPTQAAPPARPRRGDELDQPEPSPSGPITAPTPKPMLDVTGSVARTQGEIRKGAPGEDLQAAEDRALATEEQGNPVKDDWIARELISGAAAGPIIGHVAGAVAAPIRKVASAVAESTAGREAGRALTRIAEGAREPLRVALGKVAPEAKEMLKDKPWLAKGKTSADLARNFTEEGKALTAERHRLFELADSHAKPPASEASAPLEVDEAAGQTTKLADPNWKPPQSSADTGGVPETPQDYTPSGKSDVTSQVTGPDGMPRVKHGPGAPLSLVSSKIDERIAKLSQGTVGDREVARLMGEKKAAIEAAHAENGAIPSSKLREQMSEYQSAYDKTASAATNRADKEMSKALGDSLKAHVDDPALYSQIEKLTDQMSVTTRAAKALEQKAGKEAAPGGPPSHGTVKKIFHDVTHSHSGTIPTALKVAHKYAGSPAASAADRALGGMARRMDPAIAAVVQRGAAEHWGAARLAQEIARVQPAMADEESP